MVAKGLKSHFLFSTQLITSQELTQLFAAICVLQAETAWRKEDYDGDQGPSPVPPLFHSLGT